MKNYILLFFLVVGVAKLNAQTLRPQVLVIGNSNAAVAAAIQAAQSNAKTILVLQAGGFDIVPIGNNLHSGVEAEFLRRLKAAQSLNDSLNFITIDKHIANKVLEVWTDSLKNLTVIKNTVWTKADRSGKGWVFKLADGRTVRPSIFVNIADQQLSAALKIEYPKTTIWNEVNYPNPLYKTSVATGKIEGESTNSFFSMYDFLLPNQENLVFVNDPSSMLLGQSAGAVAAYGGFFNTKISEESLKRIQGELIFFKTNLMPFADITLEDKNWKAIQLVGLTGVLKAQHSNGQLLFNAQAIVSAAEIKQPMKDHFYKAQIWFDDYKNDTLSVSDALDLITYVANKAVTATHTEVEKKWKSIYGFSTDFKLTKNITRREFATLLQDYLPPFNITLDRKGNILR